MGLRLLGRGARGKIMIASLHIGGAAFGGFLTGAVVGLTGAVFSLHPLRPFVIAITAVLLLIAHARRPRVKFGLRRQVPQHWVATMPQPRRYLLWGGLLGSGVTTVIPYSAFVLLLSVQLTSGVLLGAVSGAIFGLARQGTAALAASCRVPIERLGASLATLHNPALRLNTVALVGGAVALVYATSLAA